MQDARRCGDGAKGPPRRRGPLASTHFMLSRRFPAPAGGARSASAGPAGDILLMAIPKRLLKRAIDRNTLRRIAREAWRAGLNRSRPRSPALLRLVRRPVDFDGLTHRARKRLWREEIDELLARDADA